MCSSAQEEQAQKNCVQLDDKVNNHSHSDAELEANNAGGVVKKVVFKIGSQLLGESDVLSESEEENLVMDFSENEESFA